MLAHKAFVAPHVLTECVQDPDASNEDTDEVLTRQFAAFGDALGDDSLAVRAEAVSGLGGLLDTYWELVPAGVTAGFLQRIAGEQPLCMYERMSHALIQYKKLNTGGGPICRQLL